MKKYRIQKQPNLTLTEFTAFENYGETYWLFWHGEYVGCCGRIFLLRKWARELWREAREARS